MLARLGSLAGGCALCDRGVPFGGSGGRPVLCLRRRHRSQQPGRPLGRSCACPPGCSCLSPRMLLCLPPDAPVSAASDAPMPEGVVCDRSEPVLGGPSPPAVSASWEGAAVRVSWVPSPGARPTHYNVYQELRSGEWYGCVYQLAGNLAETSYHHRDQVKPVPDAPRHVRVTGRTDESLTVEWVLRADQESHEASYAVSACNSEGCSDPFSWDARVGVPHDIQHFELRRSSPQDPAATDTVTIEPPAGGKHRDVGLQPDTVYFYELSVCSETGCSEPGQGAGLTEAAGPVDTPSVPSIRGEKIDVSLGTDTARVIWDEVEGATYYQVYQGENLDAEVSAPATSYRDAHRARRWARFNPPPTKRERATRPAAPRSRQASRSYRRDIF